MNGISFGEGKGLTLLASPVDLFETVGYARMRGIGDGNK